MSEHNLYARYMLCPMPVIKTQDKINELAIGDILHVICTDPGALSDIPIWARIHGHQVISQRKNGEEITITVKVGI